MAERKKTAVQETAEQETAPASPKEEEELKAEKAVYIGDSDVDIQTAQNSGLPCISVTWGFRDKDFLTQHGATAFVDAPTELVSLICE